MSKLRANAEEFVPGPKGYKTGPPGKEETVFRDVYKNKKTGQLLDFTKLDRTSSRPNPDDWEPVTDVSKRQPRGGKSRRRKMQKKKRSTRKH